MASAGPYASLHLAPDNHASTPPLGFLLACHPTNSVKALKAVSTEGTLSSTHFTQITFSRLSTSMLCSYLFGDCKGIEPVKETMPVQSSCFHVKEECWDGN